MYILRWISDHPLDVLLCYNRDNLFLFMRRREKMLGYLANVSLPFVVQLHELALVEKLGTVNTVFCSRAIREGDKKKKKGKVAPVN